MKLLVVLEVAVLATSIVAVLSIAFDLTRAYQLSPPVEEVHNWRGYDVGVIRLSDGTRCAVIDGNGIDCDWKPEHIPAKGWSIERVN